MGRDHCCGSDLETGPFSRRSRAPRSLQVIFVELQSAEEDRVQDAYADIVLWKGSPTRSAAIVLGKVKRSGLMERGANLVHKTRMCRLSDRCDTRLSWLPAFKACPRTRKVFYVSARTG